MPRRLVLLGSGETSPTMIPEHRSLLAEVPQDDGACVLLCSTYGFQENVDELTARIQQYFRDSVGRAPTALPLCSPQEPPAVVAATARALAAAHWAFAGPGSPTYALRVWRDTGIDAALHALLQRGTLVLASAAALTAGTHTVPVYEIYKVGEDPAWRQGLDLLGAATGLRAAVVPHFDNTDGGTHDTRYCFVGERRMAALEADLPNDVFILGIDEHTGVAFDLDERSVRVFGRGVMTVRMGGRSWTVSAGSSVAFDAIAEHAGTRLTDVRTEAVAAFDPDAVHALLDAGQVSAAVDALLSLSDVERDPATRAAMQGVVSRLGELAANPRIDLQTVAGPFIDALLEARAAARRNGFWSEADAIRDRLTSLRVTVQDGPAGSTWSIEGA